MPKSRQLILAVLLALPAGVAGGCGSKVEDKTPKLSGDSKYDPNAQPVGRNTGGPAKSTGGQSAPAVGKN